MSHITVVKTEFRDPAAIIAAAEAMGLTVERNTTARYFGNRQSELCDLVVKLPGRYDLGFKRQANGTYSFVCDEELLGGRYGTDGFGRNDPGRAIIGEEGKRFRQEYAVQKAMMTARRKGQSVQRINLPNGKVQLRIQGR